MCCQPKTLAAPLSFNTLQGFVLLIKQITSVQQRLSPALGKLLCWFANLFEELTKSIISVGIHRSDRGSSRLLTPCLFEWINPSHPQMKDNTDETPFPIACVGCLTVSLILSLDPESFTTYWWQPHSYDLHFLDYMLGVRAFQLNI